MQTTAQHRPIVIQNFQGYHNAHAVLHAFVPWMPESVIGLISVIKRRQWRKDGLRLNATVD